MNEYLFHNPVCHLVPYKIGRWDMIWLYVGFYIVRYLHIAKKVAVNIEQSNET